METFSGSHRYVLDFLTEEVLDRQPEELRAFLLETSVLERLSGALCDAVTGRTDSQALLEPSSGRTCSWSRWTRSAAGGATTTCSPTCSAPASSRSGRSGCRSCTAAAAAWYEAHGLADDAIRHALAAGDAAWAARLIERQIRRAHPVLGGGDGAAVDRRPARRAGPAPARGCCLAQALLALMRGQLEAIEGPLDAAERRVADTPTSRTSRRSAEAPA